MVAVIYINQSILDIMAMASGDLANLDTELFGMIMQLKACLLYTSDLQDHLHNKYYYLGFGKNMLRKIVKTDQKQKGKEC